MPTKRVSRISDIGDLRSGHFCDLPIQSAKRGRFRRDLVGAGVRYPPKSLGQLLKIWGRVRRFGADIAARGSSTTGTGHRAAGRGAGAGTEKERGKKKKRRII